MRTSIISLLTDGYTWVRQGLALFLILCLFPVSQAGATPTENLGIRILPKPGHITMDGNVQDWDLSGGIFICDNVETQRDTYAVWLHAMYDADNLYILARWTDPAPLNNPGSVKGDQGFNGDCLQFRIITSPDSPQERASHWTCWRGREETDLMDVQYGRQFDQGHIPNARSHGARQTFKINSDGKGYTQEIALPWSLLTREGHAPKPGTRLNLTAEPNFTIGASNRLTLKDIFNPNISIDRVFTFMNAAVWGWATLTPVGHVIPTPVRIADTREFTVRMVNGLPSIDWAGLHKVKVLEGFKTIQLEMPQDGYVSLILKNAEGRTVRQLLNAAFLTKGRHRVKWDGLTSPSASVPGKPVPPGRYTWHAIYHTGIGLKLRGWAASAGKAPWDNGLTTGWGGDHGVPVTAATDGQWVYLGWSSSEAGKALVAVDLQGNVVWRNTRGGIGGAQRIAVDSGTVYALNDDTLYRVDSQTGLFSAWGDSNSTDLPIKSFWPAEAGKMAPLAGMDAVGGKLYLSVSERNLVLVVDGQTGKLLKLLTVAAPGAVKAVSESRLLVLSSKRTDAEKPLHQTEVLTLNPTTGQATTILSGLNNATAITLDQNGHTYIGLSEPDNQIKVFDAAGHPVRTIGRAGGRAKLGRWTPDGLLFISGLAAAPDGKLWVMEADEYPKRVSVWNVSSGKFVQELFGPTRYGATGGSINPVDPNIMVGDGCEWRIDPSNGQATCLGTITRDGMGNSRFGVGANGRLYLIVDSGDPFHLSDVRIFERISDGDYKLRGKFIYQGKDNTATTIYWADRNGDSQTQPDEVTTVPGTLRFSSWYLYSAPDLTLYTRDYQLKVRSFTSAGAPEYDLSTPTRLPGRGSISLGSVDGRLVLREDGVDGTEHGVFACYDMASGKVLWDYPDTFIHVHGSHNAPPAETGLIRGSFGPCGVAQLPNPIGNFWLIPTNVGEWHILTQDGYYLGRLFQPDPLKTRFPDQAIPGADMTDAPPGSGGEDFGASATQGSGGKLYIQAGKTAFWNLEVTGLDTVRSLGSDAPIEISTADVRKAQEFHDRAAQMSIGSRLLTVKKFTPTFTGNPAQDFQVAEVAGYSRSDAAQARSLIAWDDRNLYLGWEVRDNTPWVNGATEPDQMYISGDTVDFQIGTNAKVDKDRGEAVLGDLRLSIGNLQGTPTAVLYRKVANNPHPRSFRSGIIANYVMQSVEVVPEVTIKVNKRSDGYAVEAAVPLAKLGLQPADDLLLKGDFGVTYGDPSGLRTRLRMYWSNQHTGIVDDAVFELMMEPKNWGRLVFKQ